MEITLGNGNAVRDDARIPTWQELDPGELAYDIGRYNYMLD